MSKFVLYVMCITLIVCNYTSLALSQQNLEILNQHRKLVYTSKQTFGKFYWSHYNTNEKKFEYCDAALSISVGKDSKKYYDFINQCQEKLKKSTALSQEECIHLVQQNQLIWAAMHLEKDKEMIRMPDRIKDNRAQGMINGNKGY